MLLPLVIAGAVCAPVTSAAAVTNISPPTISASSVGLYTVGTSVTFTFTDDGTPAPVAYQYTVDGGATHTVPAPSGTASADFVPYRQHSRLIAYAVAADGTVSGATVDDLYATAATPTPDKDLNGDGRPDLLTVGTTSGLGPGLWQATGSPGRDGTAGRVTVPATDIGVNGNGIDSPGSPTDFNGAAQFATSPRPPRRPGPRTSSSRGSRLGSASGCR